MEAGNIHHKWKQSLRVRINIGRSCERHCSAVLNINTRLVSPQLQAKFDPSFQTVKKSPEMEAFWQIKAKFVAQRESTTTAKVTTQKKVSRPSKAARQQRLKLLFHRDLHQRNQMYKKCDTTKVLQRRSLQYGDKLIKQCPAESQYQSVNWLTGKRKTTTSGSPTWKASRKGAKAEWSNGWMTHQNVNYWYVLEKLNYLEKGYLNQHFLHHA